MSQGETELDTVTGSIRLARGVAGWSSVFEVAPFRITLFEVVAAWTYSPHSWHARDR